jgi:hypothetical protein
VARFSSGKSQPKPTGDLAELGQVSERIDWIAAVDGGFGPVSIEPDPGQSGLDFGSHAKF